MHSQPVVNLHIYSFTPLFKFCAFSIKYIIIKTTKVGGKKHKKLKKIVASYLYSNKNIQDIGSYTKIKMTKFHRSHNV